MRRTDFREYWRDASLAQTLLMWLPVVAPVALNYFRFVEATPTLASKARNCIEQCMKLGSSPISSLGIASCEAKKTES